MTNKEAWFKILDNHRQLIKLCKAAYPDISPYHDGDIEALQIVHDMLMKGEKMANDKQKEIYKEAWDRNGELFKLFKEIMKDINKNHYDTVEIELPREAVIEILTTFSHCRANESLKPQYDWYWKDKIPKPARIEDFI